MSETFDVVVVGSGFGGAVLALRLAEAGRSVCVLERGKRWDPADFPRTIGQASRAIWQDGRSYGLFEYKVFGQLDVIQGSAVGGGSLHYFNVRMRTPPEVFRRPAWPAPIDRALLDRYYDRAGELLDAAPLAPPAGRALPTRTRAFLAAAEAAGRRPSLVPIAVHTGAPRSHPASGAVQEPCDYNGNCLLGCRVQAKNSLDLTYLRIAEQRHGAAIRPLHEVDRLAPLDGGGFQVDFRRHDPDRPGRAEPGSIVARQVVLAAGSLGTTRLLLRCRDVHKTLPKLSRALGAGFSTNGDFLFAATRDADREVDPGEGPSITAGADFSTETQRIFIEDLGVSNELLWLIEGSLPNANRLSWLFEAAATYAGAALGLRRRRSRIGFEADRLLGGGMTGRLLPYLGMGSDAADGVMRLDGDGELDVRWNPRGSRAMYDAMERAFESLSRALGGRYQPSFLWRWPLRRQLTAHPLGGCRIGADPTDSVVDERGRVWGYDGLFVADGAIIPTALTVNPSLTISALAERIAHLFVHDRELAV